MKFVWLLPGLLLLLGQAGPDCERAARLVAEANNLSFDQAGLARKVELYRQATVLCPAQAEAHNNLGDTYERLRRYDEALASYQAAAKAKPDWAYPYFGLGDVLRVTGHPDEAIYYYRKGLKFAPRDEKTLEWLAKLTAGEPAGLVTSRAIGDFLTGRSIGVVSIPLDEQLVPFEFDSASLRPGARAQIREVAHALADVLGGTRSIRIATASGPPLMEIAGHADVRGTAAYNYDLALRRAQAVVDELVTAHGIPRARLRATSYGKSQPLCGEDTEACHARNRRVEIRRPGAQSGAQR